QWSSTPPGFVDSISKISIRPKDSAIYYLTETISSTGCQTKDSFILDVHLLPLAFTTFNQDICLGDSLAIGSAAVPSYAYSWVSSPAGFSSSLPNPFVRPKAQTTYVLIETTAFGCMATHSVIITVHALPPDPGIRTKDSICPGQSRQVRFHPSG